MNKTYQLENATSCIYPACNMCKECDGGDNDE